MSISDVIPEELEEADEGDNESEVSGNCVSCEYFFLTRCEDCADDFYFYSSYDSLPTVGSGLVSNLQMCCMWKGIQDKGSKVHSSDVT